MHLFILFPPPFVSPFIRFDSVTGKRISSKRPLRIRSRVKRKIPTENIGVCDGAPPTTFNKTAGGSTPSVAESAQHSEDSNATSTAKFKQSQVQTQIQDKCNGGVKEEEYMPVPFISKKPRHALGNADGGNTHAEHMDHIALSSVPPPPPRDGIERELETGKGDSSSNSSSLHPKNRPKKMKIVPGSVKVAQLLKVKQEPKDEVVSTIEFSSCKTKVAAAFPAGFVQMANVASTTLPTPSIKSMEPLKRAKKKASLPATTPTPTPVEVQPRRFKTKLCHQYEKNGSCSRGDTCDFAHGHEELQVPKSVKFTKTKLCHDFERDGKCKRGKNCEFAHGAEQLELPSNFKRSICKDFKAQGKCIHGDKCWFLHGNENVTAKQQQKRKRPLNKRKHLPDSPAECNGNNSKIQKTVNCNTKIQLTQAHAHERAMEHGAKPSPQEGTPAVVNLASSEPPLVAESCAKSIAQLQGPMPTSDPTPTPFGGFAATAAFSGSCATVPPVDWGALCRLPASTSSGVQGKGVQIKMEGAADPEKEVTATSECGLAAATVDSKNSIFGLETNLETAPRGSAGLMETDEGTCPSSDTSVLFNPDDSVAADALPANLVANYGFTFHVSGSKVTHSYQDLKKYDLRKASVAVVQGKKKKVAKDPKGRKRRLCHQFEKKGSCIHGKECGYAHGAGELGQVVRRCSHGNNSNATHNAAVEKESDVESEKPAPQINDVKTPELPPPSFVSPLDRLKALTASASDSSDAYAASTEGDGKQPAPSKPQKSQKRKEKDDRYFQKQRDKQAERDKRDEEKAEVLRKVPCKFFAKGRCEHGDDCQFFHDPALAILQEDRLRPKNEVLCKFIASKSCTQGDGCPYSHDTRRFPCRFFVLNGCRTGACLKGANCLFSHDPVSERDKARLLYDFDQLREKNRIKNEDLEQVADEGGSTP
jgi:hypothetical protein